MNYKLFIYIAFSLLFCVANAQNKTDFSEYVDSTHVALYFSTGNTDVDTLNPKNRETINKLKKLEARQKKDSSLYVPRVEITSSVSPEGEKETNAKVKKDRLDNSIHFISRYINLPQYTKINFDGRQTLPIIWKELSTLVKKSDLKNKAEILHILSKEDKKLIRIYAMDADHSTWKLIEKEFFPELRKTVAIIYFKERKIDKTEERQMLSQKQTQNYTAKQTRQEPPAKKHNKDTIFYQPILAITTNLLYNALLAPNISIEIPIKQHISITASYINPWWVAKDDSWCYQLRYGEISGKYWFNKDENSTLTGHAVGLYAGAGLYDLEIHSQGRQGEVHINAGASYHYAKSFGKESHWRIALGAGLGIIQTKYSKYTQNDDNELLIWQSDNKLTALLPTKVDVNIGYLIHRKIVKKGKETNYAN